MWLYDKHYVTVEENRSTKYSSHNEKETINNKYLHQ